MFLIDFWALTRKALKVLISTYSFLKVVQAYSAMCLKILPVSTHCPAVKPLPQFSVTNHCKLGSFNNTNLFWRPEVRTVSLFQKPRCQKGCAPSGRESVPGLFQLLVAARILVFWQHHHSPQGQHLQILLCRQASWVYWEVKSPSAPLF